MIGGSHLIRYSLGPSEYVWQKEPQPIQPYAPCGHGLCSLPLKVPPYWGFRPALRCSIKELIIYFNKKVNTNDIRQLCVHGSNIDRVTKFKLLGVFISSDL